MKKITTAPNYNTIVNYLDYLGYKFCVNELDDSIECNGERMTDFLDHKLRSEMRDSGFKNLASVQDGYYRLALSNKYHPIRDYLNALSYDGGQHIAYLASFFQDKHDIFYTWLRRWLIGACAKTIEGGQNPMLVLDGNQDLGKSFFARWLCPKRLRSYFVEMAINPDDKDTLIRLARTWIWEVAELQSTTRRADREALKHFITQGQVTVRKPYDKFDIVKPALSSFIGTVNNDTGLLSDPTGNRRYLICHLTYIDWTYQEKCSVDDIWAEAYTAYIAGEDWRLSVEELQKRAEINQEYEQPDVVEELIKRNFNFTNDPNDWMSSLEILDHLQLNGLSGNQRANMMAIASTMVKLGISKTRKTKNNQRIWGYGGITTRSMGP